MCRELKKYSDAVAILHRRYVKNDPSQLAALALERLNAQVASLIYEIRNHAGKTQSELARMVGTTQSVISRLEDADYDGHSLTMLSRIASALNHNLTISLTARDPNADDFLKAYQ